MGKGIRSTPRDALIAESVDPSIRGRAFGFHAAAGNAGAVPLIAFAILALWHMRLRTVFWLTAIPGILAFMVLWMFVRDVPREIKATERPPLLSTDLPKRFWTYLGVVFIFTLGNSTDSRALRDSPDGAPEDVRKDDEQDKDNDSESYIWKLRQQVHTERDERTPCDGDVEPALSR